MSEKIFAYDILLSVLVGKAWRDGDIWHVELITRHGQPENHRKKLRYSSRIEAIEALRRHSYLCILTDENKKTTEAP